MVKIRRNAEMTAKMGKRSQNGGFFRKFSVSERFLLILYMCRKFRVIFVEDAQRKRADFLAATRVDFQTGCRTRK